MATCLSTMSESEIAELVFSWCRQKGFEVARQTKENVEGREVTTFEARPLSTQSISAVKFRFHGDGGKSTVRVDVRASKTLRVGLPVLALVVATKIFIGLSSPAKTGALSELLHLGVGLFSGLFLLLVVKVSERKMTACENSFWGLLRGKEVILEKRSFPGPVWFWALFLLGVAVTFSVLLYLAPARLLALYFVVGSLWISVAIVLHLSLREQPCRWKMLLMIMTTRWVEVCIWGTVVVVVFLGAVNGVVVLTPKNSSVTVGERRVVPAELLGKAFSEEAYRRVTRSFEQENAHILKARVREKLRKEKGLDGSGRATNRRMGVFGAVIFVSLAGLACFYLLKVRNLLMVGERWEREAGLSEGSRKIAPPPAHFVVSAKWRAISCAILVHFLLGSAFTVSGVLVALDAMSYVLAKETVVFKNLAVLYAWVFTSGDMFLPRTVSLVIGNLLLLVFALPFLVFSLCAVKRAIGFVSWRLRCRWSKNKEPLARSDEEKIEEVRQFVATVCERHELKVPGLVVMEGVTPPVSIRGRLFSRRSCLRVSRDAITRLDKEELAAAAAHELGHLFQGLRKTEWLRLVSMAAMYSNNYLTLIGDPVRSEIEADRFAVRAGVAPEAMISAITKAGMFGGSPSKSGWRRIRFWLISATERIFKVRDVDTVADFFFGDGIVGYTYPVLSERVGYLEQAQGETVGSWYSVRCEDGKC